MVGCAGGAGCGVGFTTTERRNHGDDEEDGPTGPVGVVGIWLSKSVRRAGAENKPSIYSYNAIRLVPVCSSVGVRRGCRGGGVAAVGPWRARAAPQRCAVGAGGSERPLWPGAGSDPPHGAARHPARHTLPRAPGRSSPPGFFPRSRCRWRERNRWLSCVRRRCRSTAPYFLTSN